MLATFSEDAEQYPLVPKAGTGAGQAVAERLTALMSGFVRHAQGNIIFDSDASLVNMLITWLTSMTTSVVRTIRHTGTFLGRSSRACQELSPVLMCMHASSFPPDDRAH